MAVSSVELLVFPAPRHRDPPLALRPTLHLTAPLSTNYSRSEYDRLCKQNGVYKVQVIGDAFMCMAGCPER